MVSMRIAVASIVVLIGAANKCDNCYTRQGGLDGCNACDNCRWSSYDSACVPMGPESPCPAEYYHHCSNLDPKCDPAKGTCDSCSSDAMCSWNKEVRSDTPSGYLWACYPSASQFHRLANGSITFECRNKTASRQASNVDNCYKHQGDLQGCNTEDNCRWSSYDRACVPMGPESPCPAKSYHHCSNLDPKCDPAKGTCDSCSSDAMCSWNKEVRSDTPSGYLWACYPSASQCKKETANGEASNGDNCYKHQGDLQGCNTEDNCRWSSYDRACVPMGPESPCPAKSYHHCSNLDPKCDPAKGTCDSCSSDATCSWNKEVRSDTPSGYLWACYPSASQCKKETAWAFDLMV